MSAALAAMALTMVFFVHILSNVAVEYEIRQDLDRIILKNLKYIYFNDEGKLIYKEGFSLREGDIYFLVLDSSGTILCGEYPKGCPQDAIILGKRQQKVTSAGETFYVRDLHKTGKKKCQVYLRSVVCKSDIKSHYQDLKYLAYLIILLVFGIAILGGSFLARHISNSLKEMCRSAEKIGQGTDMSNRMEYNGQFYELMVLTQANNRMLDRLEETFRQQEQFTSDVAHELRTPVAVMNAQCQYVRTKKLTEEDYKEAFEVIHRQSQKVSSIISRLLELSRLDSDRRQLRKEVIDLPEIVQSICEDLQQKSGDALQITQNLAQAHTIGDISLVTIAVQNLLTNAAKYSEKNSPIEVETGMQNGMVFVSVRDHGTGIREEDVPHIFKRFYKADKSRNTEGFGLGLPLTMKIAQKHGGTVTAESRPGEGSTFTLLLPYETQAS